MEVLFLILKIIGIGLLVLLGIFLFIVCSLVFVPVRYRIRGKGEVPKEFEGDMVFSWFLHLIHCRIRYDNNDLKYKLRIFGIPINLGKEKKPKRRKEKQRVNDLEMAEVQEEPEELMAETFSEEADNTSEADVTAGKRKKRQKPKRKGWLKRKIQQLKRSFLNLKEQLHDIKSIISEETNKRAVSALIQEMKYLLKHYSPRKALGELQYGMEDPAQTGEILGVVSIFPFWYRYKISVIPDFTAESFYAKGHLLLRGRIRSFHLLVSGVRLIRNKDIRKLISQIRK